MLQVYLLTSLLTQLVHLPTGRGETDTLDLILTNCPNSVSSVEIADNLPGTDHDVVEFALSFLPVTHTQPNRVLYTIKKLTTVFLEVFITHSLRLFLI